LSYTFLRSTLAWGKLIIPGVYEGIVLYCPREKAGVAFGSYSKPHLIWPLISVWRMCYDWNMAQPKTATVIRQLGLSPTLAEKADKRAVQLGLSTPEYIRYLIVQDEPTPKEYISLEAEQEYLRDIIEFLAAEKVSPKPGTTSAKELRRRLEGYESHQNHKTV
jgi:hypothetical protein